MSETDVTASPVGASTARARSACSAELASSDLSRPPAIAAPHGRAAAFLDEVFLAWMRTAPTEVSRALVDLFERAPIGAVARFLSETAGPIDHARVMAAMPTAPFLRIARERLGGS